MANIAILLLAAGMSSRMQGRDKLLEPIDGVPLLSRITQQALQTDCAVYVAVPSLNHPRATLVPGAKLVPVKRAAEGMGASIAAGVAALDPEIEAVMICPSDMPEIIIEDFECLAAAFEREGGPILRAVDASGAPGHPVLFPRRCFPDLINLEGDTGARNIVSREAVKLVELPGTHATTDLDTPEAWADWRRKQN